MGQKNDFTRLAFCHAGAGFAQGGQPGKRGHYLFDEGEPEQKQPAANGQQDTVSRVATRKKQQKKEIVGWIVSLAVAVAMALLLRFFVFEFVVVDGPSMEKTLWSKEVVLIEKVSYRFSAPQRFDIIFFTAPDNDILVKRIVGLPGDKLEIRNFKLYVNDQPVDEPYLNEPMDSDYGPVTVEEGAVFCMGDNRNLSVDSRFENIGTVPFDRILGRGVFIVWPLNRIAPLPEQA